MDCPKCGHKSLLGDECLTCGIFVSKYLEVQAHTKETEPQKEKIIEVSSPKSPMQAIHWLIESAVPKLSKYKKFIIAGLIVVATYSFVKITWRTSGLSRTGILIGIFFAFKVVMERLIFEKGRKRRTAYYRDHYLKSDEWKRKRSLVLKRDGGRCTYCGAPATQVHHKRYAPKNIGREPIAWLTSVCEGCHGIQHHK